MLCTTGTVKKNWVEPGTLCAQIAPPFSSTKSLHNRSPMPEFASCIIAFKQPFVNPSYYYHKPGFPDIPAQDTAKQLAWLADVLAHSKEQWKLVFGHHPIFSAGTVHGNTPELIARIKPLLEKYHAQVYFSGHDHDLQHLKEKGGDIDYILNGAGGEPRPAGRDALSIRRGGMFIR
jgi:Calcineurin-like phosphoesterase